MRDYGLQDEADDVVLKRSDEEDRMLIYADTDSGMYQAFLDEAGKNISFDKPLPAFYL